MSSTTLDAKNTASAMNAGAKRKSFRPFLGGPLLTVQCKKPKITKKEWSEKELKQLRDTYDRCMAKYKEKLEDYGSLIPAPSKANIEATLNIPFKRYTELVGDACDITAMHYALYEDAQRNKQPTDWCKGLNTFSPIDITATFFFHEPLDIPTPGDMYSCERAIGVWKEGKAANPGTFEWLRKPKYGNAFFFIITQLQQSVVHLERTERPHANIGGIKIRDLW